MMGLYGHMWFDAPEPIEEDEETEPETNEHDYEWYTANGWGREADDDRDAAFPERAFVPF